MSGETPKNLVGVLPRRVAEEEKKMNKKSNLWVGITATLLFCGCGQEAAGTMFMDAGYLTLSDGEVQTMEENESANWQPISCIAEPPYTTTVVDTSDSRFIVTMTTTVTLYTYRWEGEPEDWLVKTRLHYLSDDPCYPYNTSWYVNHGYTCSTSLPWDEYPREYVSYAIGNSDGELRILCGQDKTQLIAREDLEGIVMTDEPETVLYDPNAVSYWIARH